VNAPLAWLRRHDPGLVTVRRAVRVTLVACLGFYLCRYAIGNAAMAPYALFGAVALGALSVCVLVKLCPAERGASQKTAR